MSQEQDAGSATATTADPARPEGDDILASIERAVDSIRAMDDVDPDQHAQRFSAVHEVLQTALTDTDVRKTH